MALEAGQVPAADQVELPRIAAGADQVPPRLTVPAHRGHGILSAEVAAALLWTPRPAAFGSTREIRITFLAPPVQALCPAEVPWGMPELEVALEAGQVPAAVPVKVAHFQAASLELVAGAVVEQGQVPAEELERDRVVGRIFGGLLPAGAMKLTARKEDVGPAQQQGCAADAPPAQARWPSRQD